MLETSM